MIRRHVFLYLELFIFLFCLAVFPSASFAVTEGLKLDPVKLDAPPVIDGVLTDSAWSGGPTLNPDLITYNPLRGQILPMKTEIWAAYDSRNLYFAFRCADPEPGQIKTSVTQRDNIFSDDWVGISLDALGSRQSSYDLFVNPDGIQADILNSVSNGEDTAPDWVWASAGKRTPEGYQVEICIPLRNIRYQSGDEVTMGILFWRKISRRGLSGSWPAIPEGKGVFGNHAGMTLQGIETERNITILPSITFGSTREREHPGAWNNPDRAGDLGLGLTWGITSSLTAEATVNPDFSQVESDAFQVEVNRRYPLFFEEKRPYFMETRSFFNIAGAGDNSSLYTSVHTRKIIDPRWSAKLNGVAGKTSYGVLFAEDSWTADETGSTGTEESPKFAIARTKYSLKGESYLGGIYTGHSAGEAWNQVGGMDGVLVPGPHQNITFSLLGSASRPDTSGTEQGGTMAAVSYKYDTRSFLSLNYFEHYSRDFSMDTAFYERTGFTRVQTVTGLKFYPSGKFSWVKRVTPYIWASSMKDAYSGMHDYAGNITIQANFSRQGYARIRRWMSRESWAGQYFHCAENVVNGNIQITKQLSLNAFFNTGTQIYYDAAEPFRGDHASYGGGFTLQPNDKFRQSVDYEYSDLINPANGARTYLVQIVNSRSTYQFNRYFFVRATLQYNSWNDTLLQDYLASFTFIPGTVVHLGYGSLSERQEYREDEWVKGAGDLHPLRESLFFKTSYLHRF